MLASESLDNYVRPLPCGTCVNSICYFQSPAQFSHSRSHISHRAENMQANLSCAILYHQLVKFLHSYCTRAFCSEKIFSNSGRPNEITQHGETVGEESHLNSESFCSITRRPGPPFSLVAGIGRHVMGDQQELWGSKSIKTRFQSAWGETERERKSTEI